jgi:hypothetical protein
MRGADLAKTGAKKIARVQTGVRIERRILQILKSVAAFHEISLGDLLEGIFLHAFEGKPAFGDETMALIKTLRETYGFDLTAADSHMLLEDAADGDDPTSAPGPTA